jgi:hypothetical protein
MELKLFNRNSENMKKLLRAGKQVEVNVELEPENVCANHWFQCSYVFMQRSRLTRKARNPL